MSIIPKIDLFAMSLPNNCLYCKFGNVVLNGNDDLIGDHLACMRHAAYGLKSKKFADVPKPNRDFKRTFCPIMNWDETCDSFAPIEFGGKKFKVLDYNGLFDAYISDDIEHVTLDGSAGVFMQFKWMDGEDNA